MGRWWLVAVGLVALAGSVCSLQRHSAVVVDHPVALADTRLSIRIVGLRPGTTATVTASTNLLTRRAASSAAFTADDHGSIDLATATPTSGSYTMADPMGMFWAMTDRGVAAQRGPIGRFVVKLVVRSAGRSVASTEVTRLLSAPGEQQSTLSLATNGIVGRFFRPPSRASSGRRPGVVVFGGSEGGMGGASVWASMLAAHGFPALAIAYFGAPGLPEDLTNIRLEYFSTAAHWLATRPEVDQKRVWLLSASRGSEAALLVGGTSPDVHGVIVSAPSSRVYGSLGGSGSAWTSAGVPLPYAPADFSKIVRTSRGLIDRPGFEAGLDTQAGRAAAIPVEQIRGPVLTIAGGDDHLWPSTTYAAEITRRLDASHFPFVHQALTYPNAGHGAFGIPYIERGTGVVVLRGYRIVLGGTPEANERACEDAWLKVLAFIERN